MTEGHEPSSRFLTFFSFRLFDLSISRTEVYVSHASLFFPSESCKTSGFICGTFLSNSNWLNEKNRGQQRIFCSVMIFIIFTSYQSSFPSCNLTVKLPHPLKKLVETGLTRSICIIYKLITKFNYLEPWWQFKGTKTFLSVPSTLAAGSM